jgi:acetylornithine deacetylase
VSIARGDAVALTKALVAIDSQNPSLVKDGHGEFAVALALAEILRDWGFAVETVDAAPGRPNVIARIGHDGGRSLMFNGHLDVVGVEGMTHRPFDPVEHEGRIYGRGSADMKSGIAAMCAAAARAADQKLDSELIVTAVIDEEFTSVGTKDLVSRGVRADAAIVTEPTSLAIMPAHKGFVWIKANVRGRAAHGSRWDLGVDAVRHAGLLLAEVDRYDAETLTARSHPLVGRPSIHASFIEGGSGMSTYPESCVVQLERRTIPGESVGQVMAEMEELCDRVRLRTPAFDATLEMSFAQQPSDVPLSSTIVKRLSMSLANCGVRERVAGMTAWTDAALLNAAGISAIHFGPGDISVAHAAEEYVPVAEIETATKVLTDLAMRW